MLLNTACQNSQVTNLATDMAAASLVIYSGAVPASANDAAGTALATHTIAGFGAAVSGEVTASAIADATASAGTASYARISNGTQTIQLTVGVGGSGAEVIMSTLTLGAGDTSQVTSLTLSQPT